MRLQLLTPLLLTLTLPIAWLAGQDPPGFAKVFTSESQDEDQDESKARAREVQGRDQIRLKLAEAAELRRKAGELEKKAMSHLQLPGQANNVMVTRPYSQWGLPEPSQPSQPSVPGLAPVYGYDFSTPQDISPHRFIMRQAQAMGGRMSEEDKKAVELAWQFRSSKDKQEKEKLRELVKELTAEAFEKQMAQRAQQVEEAQAKLDKLKAQLEQRREASEKIIERRIADLLDDPDPYSWEFDSAAATGLFPAKEATDLRAQGFRFEPARPPFVP